MDWKIGKSRGQCCGCNREFAAGEDFYSALYDHGVEFERRDFCESCWKDAGIRESAPQSGERTNSEERPFSHWRTVVGEKPKKRGIDLELVKDVFDRLKEDEDPTHLKIRYFLSLILMRKRLFRYLRTESGEDGEYMVVTASKQKTEYRIRNPNLTQGELTDVKAELENLLDMELGEPEAEAKAEASPENASRHGGGKSGRTGA
ncbi:MAG: hypothetical protein DRP79_00615 [Planctomycetota bacterium]|nr:MAG: hypothetical protein DRP79_00615 [Planctomycetota bacterium]